MIKLIMSAFKIPITYYIWGGLSLLFGLFINPIFHINNNNRLLIISGFLVVLIGVLISLGEKRVDHIKDVKLDNEISNIKKQYLQNILRNIYAFYYEYRSKDKYLCRFYRNSGSVLYLFAESEKEAKEYMDWYLKDKNAAPRNIVISSNRACKIHPNDIEEFEYRRISWLQHNVIHPILAFFKQPSMGYVSFSKMVLLAILISVGVGGYFYLNGEYSFVGKGSFETLIKIQDISANIIFALLVAVTFVTIVRGIFSMKKALQTYYADQFRNKRTVLSQLLVLILVPLSGSFILPPMLEFLIKIAQNSGCFIS
ncbi:hypothetical protein [Vallitalea guaymasensis]|uniref:hypothetical protein n=1 Tax=Vallitalea guaymasensis TaxID=1185412 RepID=UPI000DE44062|nr:hypothetical protein [Vallitalea guaymasensis]